MKSLQIKNYIRLRIPFIILFLLSCILFPCVQYLSGYHMEGVLYSLEVEAFIVLVIVVIDYNIFNKKHKQLVERLDNISIYENGNKLSDTIIERDYEQIIERLYMIEKEFSEKMESRYLEQIEYFTMWVHQIKTPISALSLLFEDTQMDPNAKSAMKQEIFKVEQYAGMVLDYLRIDSMNSDMILTPNSLDSIVRKTIKKYSTIFIHKKNTLEVGKITSQVLTDEKWLGFLVEQILSNALKYTNKGMIKIYEEKDYIGRTTLVIQDNGIGIKEEDIPRIFEKGYTGLNGRMYQKATGIGLYLSKKVADKLSCTLIVDSKIHEGTKVSIVFPKEDFEAF